MAGQVQVNGRRLLLLSAAVVVFLVTVLSGRHDLEITGIYYRRQDAIGAIALAGLLALCAFWRPGWKLPDRMPGTRCVMAAAFALVLLLWAGTYLVMLDYPLTRDEHMVVFDAEVYRRLAFAAPLPPDWRGYGVALAPAFLLDAPGNTLMVSAYLPGNALMRMAFGCLADPALMNPVLTGVGLIALYRVSLRLFPDSPGAVWVSLGGYVLSAQILVNAMTAYAMTGHLALNCAWLMLFLKDRRWSHAAAMVVGFWAIGLHQIVFHPLFAGPLILTLLLRRRWTLFGAYAAVYAAALLFWISYQGMAAEMAGVVAGSGSAAGAGGFVAKRVLPLLASIRPAALPLMMYNVLRFMVFSPVFLLPLLGFARRPVWENQGLALPLAAGVVLTLVAMTILLPFQGHGWGYRYLQAVLPNCVLLCGYGYRAWAGQERRVADGTTAFLAAATGAVFLPFLLLTSHQFVKPHADLARLVERQTSDFAIIETESMPRTVDNVRNSPWLTNRPLVFASAKLTAGQVRELCGRGTVTVLSDPDFRKVGFVSDPGEAQPGRAGLFEWLREQACYRPPGA